MDESDKPGTSKERTEKEKAHDEPKASTSSQPQDATAGSQDSSANDALFEPSVEMMVNDFDDEQTLEEEEILASKEGGDPTLELDDLKREGEMSIDELMKLYGAPNPALNASTSGSSSRKRRRRASPKRIAPEEEEEPSTSAETKPVAATPEAVEKEESADEEDATTTTATTANLESASVADDETNFEEEEPSELNKLYTDLESKDAEQGLSEDEDFDYEPDDDEPKKTIMVGSDYQAQIPDGLCKYDDALPYENEDKLLWDPILTDGDIEEYLAKFSQINTNGGTNGISQGGKHLRDDEQALLLLLQCGNNIEEALRRRRLGGFQPTNNMSSWSEEECRNFENGIRIFGKCFHEIQTAKVKTRSVGECVQFYYIWKKTERHDVFANKSRLEKKKYNLNPCVSDFMDKYLEEYDNNGGTTNRDRSSSPNVSNSNSLLSADTKHRAHRAEAAAANAAAAQQANNSIEKVEPSEIKSE